jgi:serine/threonine protein kinase
MVLAPDSRERCARLEMHRSPTHMPETRRLPIESRWDLCADDLLAPGRRVIRRLASGGAHETFLVDVGGPWPAVAKLPRPFVAADPHRLISLRDEGEALSHLAHPGVPRYLDTVLTGPYPHLLLEYVAGPTLRTAIGRGRALQSELVADLGRTLALTLDAIARAGWTHLDVKPANIILNAAPRLLDFELARPATEAARLTEPTGTWDYMPPEQRAAGTGDGPAIGPAADVYALALSLGEALTGRSPRRRPEPEPLPGPIGAVLADALAPSPAERPTAAELAAELAALGDLQRQLELAA